VVLDSVETSALAGAAGDDLYQFDADTALGLYTLDESGGGSDTIDLSLTTTSGVAVNLGSATQQVVNSNLSLKLSSVTVFEKAVGGSGNDTLTGNSLANTLTGNAGNDRLNGGSGNDSLVGGLGDDTYVFGTATTAEADTVTEAASAGTDTLSFSTLTTNVLLNLGTTAVQTVHTNRTLKLNSASVFENIAGGSGNDTLTGNSLANILTGNSGNDKLTGGSGNDTYAFATATTAEADTVTEAASAGTDTLSFSTLTTDVILSLGTTADQTVHANRTLKLNSASVFENIAGGSGNDTLTGNSLANILVGNAGNDTLNGSGGRDILIGGLGLDTLNGGEDEDIVIAGRTTSDALFSNLNRVLVEWVSVNAYATRISNLRAGVGAPAVSFKAKVNVLNDAGEDDSLVGGNGTDWYFRALDDVVTGLVTGEVLDVL
jgi:Ca2+-binding RTX toxin-like protein